MGRVSLFWLEFFWLSRGVPICLSLLHVEGIENTSDDFRSSTVEFE